MQWERSGDCDEVTTLPAHSVFLCCFHLSDPGRDRGARDQNLSATWRRLWRGWGVQGADQSPEGKKRTQLMADAFSPIVTDYLPIHPCSPWFITFSLIPLFSIYPYSDFVSLWGSTDLYHPLPGEHSLCCDWLQPADRGEGEEDSWSSLPLGSCWSGEPGAQWLPKTTHHACVSLPGNKTA